MTYRLKHQLFQGCCCVCIGGRLPGKLGCWPKCSLCNILVQKLLFSAIEKYLCWQGNSFSVSISVSCREKSYFVLMEDTRFNSSVVLIIKAVKIGCALLFTTFMGLYPGLAEKSGFVFFFFLGWLELKITWFVTFLTADGWFPCWGCSSLQPSVAGSHWLSLVYLLLYMSSCPLLFAVLYLH